MPLEVLTLMRAGVDTDRKEPFEFARRRFTHASYELTNTDRNIYERLLNALVALSPLGAKDLPEPCQLLYEQVQRLVGTEYWSEEATSGTLAPAVRALSSRQVSAAIQLIAKAGDTLDTECGVHSADTEGPSTKATAIVIDIDDSPEQADTRTFYLT